jgi:hypothetical protein
MPHRLLFFTFDPAQVLRHVGAKSSWTAPMHPELDRFICGAGVVDRNMNRFHVDDVGAGTRGMIDVPRQDS